MIKRKWQASQTVFVLLVVLGLVTPTGSSQPVLGSSVNSFVNPDFEDGFAGWTRYPDPPGVFTAIDSTVVHHGAKSAKVIFDGTPTNYFHILQSVYVLPDMTYLLSEYLKTEDLQTVDAKIHISSQHRNGQFVGKAFVWYNGSMKSPGDASSPGHG